MTKTKKKQKSNPKPFFRLLGSVSGNAKKVSNKTHLTFLEKHTLKTLLPLKYPE